jgi:hypothetical protein
LLFEFMRPAQAVMSPLSEGPVPITNFGRNFAGSHDNTGAHERLGLLAHD